MNIIYHDEGTKFLLCGVDGILNDNNTVRTTKSGKRFVDKNKMKLLQKICGETGAKFVLISSWRHDRNDPNQNSNYLELAAELKNYGIEIADHTIILERINKKYTRADEVKRFLTKNRVGLEKYVILNKDDVFSGSIVDTVNFRYSFNQARFYELTEESAAQIISFLK